MDRWQAIGTCALVAMAASVVVAALGQHDGRTVSAATEHPTAEAPRDVQPRDQPWSEGMVGRASSTRPSPTATWQPVPIPATSERQEAPVIEHAATRLANCCKSLRESAGPHANILRKTGASCELASRDLTATSDAHGQALAAAILGAMQDGLRRAGLPAACNDTELAPAAKPAHRPEPLRQRPALAEPTR